MSPLSKQLFQLMLLAYPRDFRLAFGSEMTQFFCDCHRETQSRGLITVTEFWLRVTLDVIRTASLERWEALGKGTTMKNLKRDAIGLFACVVIIVVALLLLGYLRAHGTGSILLLGYALDAIVTAGVISNLIIFILIMTTRMSAFRTALWSLVVVNGVLLLVAMVIGNSVEAHFNFLPVVISYVVSFAFWLAIHWIWSQFRSSTQPAA